MRKLILAIIASSVILGPGPADAAARVKTFAFHKSLGVNELKKPRRIRIDQDNHLRLILSCEDYSTQSEGVTHASVLLSGSELAELTAARPRHSSEFVPDTFGVSITERTTGGTSNFAAKTGTVKLVAPAFTARLDAVAMIQYQNGVNTCTLSGTVEVIRPR